MFWYNVSTLTSKLVLLAEDLPKDTADQNLQLEVLNAAELESVTTSKGTF